MKHIYPVVILLGLIFSILWILKAADVPRVYFSYSTGECVGVEVTGDGYSCDNLPPKYDRRWVR